MNISEQVLPVRINPASIHPASIHGDGALARALRRCRPSLPVPVLALDAWDASHYSAQERVLADQSWLTAWQEPGVIWVGPLRRPGHPGCARCVAVRREAIHPYRQAYLNIKQQAAPLTALQATQVTQLLLRAAKGDGPQDALRTVWRLDTRSLQASPHRLLPVSDCPVCADRPADMRPGAPLLPAVPKTTPNSYRPPADGLEERWQEAYVDQELGLVRDLALHPISLFYEIGAHAGMPGFDKVELTSGRSVAPGKSRLSAVAEALERYGGIRPYGKRTVTRGSYRNLQGCAVDPTTLGRHDPSDMRRADMPLHTFDPDTPVSWVWASALTGGPPRLIPEHYAYYGLPGRWQEPNFFFESSNGCAVGRSLTEAALFGLLELVERDAFLLSWHARLPLRRIDLRRGCPRGTRWRIERMEALTGYRILAFDMTLDLGLPAVWAMAVDEQHRPLHPRSIHAAAAHLDPAAALDGALHELAPGIPYAVRRYPERRPELLGLLHDPYQVRQMQDHAALYWLPEAYERLDFLSENAGTVSLDDLRQRAPVPAGDLKLDLENTLERFSRAGLEVLMVDQTAPEHRVGGLHCVKMIVPGLLPMTFGHAYRRLDGLPRLDSVPLAFGRSTSLPLNLHPHPFP